MQSVGIASDQLGSRRDAADVGPILFFDIDGTLVWRDLEAGKRGEEIPAFEDVAPSPAVARALEELHERGHRFFYSTGRARCMIPQPLLDLQPDGLVAASGATVTVGDELLRDVYIPFDVLTETMRLLESARIDAEFECDDACIEFYPSGRPGRLPGAPVLRTADEFLERVGGHAISKFCLHEPDRRALEPIKPELERCFTISDLQFGTLELSMHGISKQTGIELVLERLGRGRERTFAFGDSENDLFMAPAVETFVAMGNALPQVREQASHVAPPVWEDGVVTALKQFNLV